jgi:hypothetical protein
VREKATAPTCFSASAREPLSAASELVASWAFFVPIEGDNDIVRDVDGLPLCLCPMERSRVRAVQSPSDPAVFPVPA